MTFPLSRHPACTRLLKADRTRLQVDTTRRLGALTNWHDAAQTRKSHFQFIRRNIGGARQ